MNFPRETPYFSLSSRTVCLIDTSALVHNVSIVRSYAPRSQLMAVVKANAYGHGLQAIVKALDPLVDAFAVATVEEAVELRSTGSNKPVCLLSGFFAKSQLKDLIQHKIDIVVYCSEQFRIIEQSKLSKKVGIWLKINTGMNRLGFRVESFPSQLQRIQTCASIELRGLMSHFAVADDLESKFTGHQIQRFKRVAEAYSYPLSLANSAGVLRWQQSHLDWVRPGIMLYGVSPFQSLSAEDLNLKPVMGVYSTIIAVNQLQPKDAVGYGLKWVSSSKARVGIVACGYADGYFRCSSPGAEVLIGENRAKLVGRVSMDSFAVDLTECPDAKVGTVVQLFGQGLPVENLAKVTATIPYEVLTSIDARRLKKCYQ